MADYDYDLIVIGAGSGGVRAARTAASLGAKVAIIEDRYLGGTCVNVGCVPKKLYVYASEYGHGFSDANGFGWQFDRAPRFDWNTLRKAKVTEIARLNDIYRSLLLNSGADLIDGRGTITSPSRVEVNGREISAPRILIATGGWPYIPDIPGRELAITSNEVFDLPTFPQRFLTVGGGYIASEFACVFNGLGSHVVQTYRGELFMRGFDDDARRHLAVEMQKSGVKLRTQTDVISLNKTPEGIRAEFNDGSSEIFDAVLYATGRKPNLNGLGALEQGVELTDQGVIEVDDHYQTKVPGIFALGDIIGGPELTPIALAEGMAFAHQQFGAGSSTPGYDNVATAVFTQPPLASCGLTQDQAGCEYHHLKIYRSEFKPMKHTISGRNERSFMKLIVDGDTDRVLGAHMVGPDAGEIMQGIAIAMKMGATKAQFDATIGIHPTAAEEFVTMRTLSEEILL
jgi:glutathione reductase (NADPH)